MKTIITKSAKLKGQSKQVFEKYWKLIYGPDYAKEMSMDGDCKPDKKPTKESK